MVTTLWIIYSTGYLVSCVLGYLLLQSNQWRLLTLLICIPNLLTVVTFHTFQKESLHYLWAKGETTEAEKVINWMCEMNQRPTLTWE
jgi:hypothetical protein